MKQTKIAEKPNLEIKRVFSFQDYIAIFIFALYILVDFIPTFSSYTFGDSQWLYLNLLNFFVAFYIYYNKIWLDNSIFKTFFVSKIPIFYVAFILISGLSIFVALNFHEGLITLIRYLVTFSAFVLLFVLFYDKKHTFGVLAYIISILIFIECCNGLKVFFENYDKWPISQMRSNIKHNHDNKNIFAANILIKIPFVIFCIIKSTNWKRFVFAFILFTTIFTIFFLGSRAIIVGLILQFLVLLSGFIVLKLYKKVQFKWNIVLVTLIVAVVSFVFYTVLINKSDSKINNITANSHVQTLNNQLTSAPVDLNQGSLDIRKHYWNGALDLISDRPFLGCGLGNWKLETLKYEQKWKPDNVNGVHAHNDFIEVAAETGILNGIIFCLIFVFLLIYNIKTILKSSEFDSTWLALLLIASILGLMVDSFFNFPLSRPTIQVIFVLLILFTLLNYFDLNLNSNLKTSWSKNSLFVILMISFATIYPNYLIFNFFKNLAVAKRDTTILNMSFSEVNALFNDFPSIDETGTPVVDLKINYLLKENKFEKALELINHSTKLNPYSLYSNSLRVDLYNKKMKYDSATFYAKKVYNLQPNYQIFYERYIQGLARLKDTPGILKAFEDIENNAVNANHINTTFRCLASANYGKERSLAFLKKGLIQFPNDLELIKIQANFQKEKNTVQSNLTEKELQIKASKTNDFSEIEKFYLEKYKINKTDFAMIENLGICYFQQKKYAKAIEYLNQVVESKAFQNGKSEYVMAICYSNLGDKNKSCEMALRSQNFNYEDATQFINQNCK